MKKIYIIAGVIIVLLVYYFYKQRGKNSTTQQISTKIAEKGGITAPQRVNLVNIDRLKK